MNDNIRKLKYLVEEYEYLSDELGVMVDAWNSDDSGWAAENDPGLQYEKEMEIDEKYEEIKEVLKEL